MIICWLCYRSVDISEAINNKWHDKIIQGRDWWECPDCYEEEDDD